MSDQDNKSLPEKAKESLGKAADAVKEKATDLKVKSYELFLSF
jgi:hypothetical protein